MGQVKYEYVEKFGRAPYFEATHIPTGLKTQIAEIWPPSKVVQIAKARFKALRIQ